MNERKEYKEALVKEVKRILSQLNMEDPAALNYTAMVGNLMKLDSILADIEYDERNSKVMYPIGENKCSQEEKEPFPAPEPIPEPVGEPEQSPVVEEKLTKEKVRALLKEAAEAGVMVQPIMAKFIPDGKKQTFSSVKAADYEALVKELNDARTAQ